MAITDYNLKSIPGDSIQVPEHCVEEAETLVDIALNNPTALNNLASSGEYQCLGNHGVMHRATELSELRPESWRIPLLQDIVYLRICMYHNKKRLGPDHKEVS